MKIFLSALEQKGKSTFNYINDNVPSFKWNLMSYFYVRKTNKDIVNKIIEKSELILIDSGAHSFQKGIVVDWVEYTKEYAKWIKENVTLMSENDIEDWNLKPITAKEYKSLRDTHFTAEGYVEWDEQALQYAMDENAFCGGETLMFTCGERAELIMYRVEEGKLCVVETTFEEEELRELLPAIMQNMGVKKAYADNAGGMIFLPKDMIWMEKKGYLNLTLG